MPSWRISLRGSVASGVRGMERSDDTSARMPLLLQHTNQRNRRTRIPRERVRSRSVWALVLVALAAVALVTRRSLYASDSFLASGSASTTPSTSLFDHHFATKTAYWDQRWKSTALHEKRRSLRLWPAAQAQETVQDDADSGGRMRLIQSQIVTRHGIRFPTLGPIKDVEQLLEKLSPFEGCLPEWLRGYSLQYNQSMEGELSQAGAREMERYAVRSLGAHGRGRSRDFYSSERFQLSHTHVKRTKDSALAFARKYFSNPQDVQYIERPKANDTLLRFFDVCPRYQKQVKQNRTALREMRAFALSTAINTSIMQLSVALGIGNEPVTITVKDLTAAFSACAFDVALYGIRDQWCSLFTPQMVDALDYYDDLKAFYQLASGYAINYEMASVLLQDVVQLMDQRIRGHSSVEGAFRFAHAETTLPLMTLLGFGSKAPLKATASDHDITTRGFRTSALAPFAANVEFRLYARLETPGSQLAAPEVDSYYVQVLVNERDDVVIPGCDDVFCPLEVLKTRVWKRPLYLYDFDKQCRL